LDMFHTDMNVSPISRVGCLDRIEKNKSISKNT